MSGRYRRPKQRDAALSAVELARLSCGGFFLCGLLTGVWKYRMIATSPDAQAPVYVDICHRASLMYAFACLVLAEFARLSIWSETIDLAATAVPIFFFAMAVLGYAFHGVLQDTDNSLRKPHRMGSREIAPGLMAGFIHLLIVGEIGGFLVLFAGYIRGL
jgi:hypothetical protein